VATAEAGIGFTIASDGRIAAKTLAIRQSGLRAMATGLVRAFVGGGPKAR
jgi:hypothetical protein